MAKENGNPASLPFETVCQRWVLEHGNPASLPFEPFVNFEFLSIFLLSIWMPRPNGLQQGPHLNMIMLFASSWIVQFDLNSCASSWIVQFDLNTFSQWTCFLHPRSSLPSYLHPLEARLWLVNLLQMMYTWCANVIFFPKAFMFCCSKILCLVAIWLQIQTSFKTTKRVEKWTTKRVEKWKPIIIPCRVDGIFKTQLITTHFIHFRVDRIVEPKKPSLSYFIHFRVDRC